MVFRPLAPSQAHKIKSRSDLESELFGSSSDASSTSSKVRANEGEAAEYGIYFDDTEYDYMQHVRDINSGTGDGESFFVEATEGKNRGKGKNKMSLEDALRDTQLQDERSEGGAPSTVGSHLGSEFTSSASIRRGVEAQQDVPDALAGFQPDMDPRLREVLEALDDEAYVDDEEDIFGEIAKDRREMSLEEFEDTLYEDVEEDDDGWESDVTEKPQHEYKDSDSPSAERLSESDLLMLNAPLSDVPDIPADNAESPIPANGDWMKEFSKFKQDQKVAKPKMKVPPALQADLQSSITSTTRTTSDSLASGRSKKRKGALTSSTAFSMTSSALARTEGLTTLDRRFDKIEEEYAAADDDLDSADGGMMPLPEDDDTASVTTTATTTTTKSSIASQSSSHQTTPPSLVAAAGAVRGDFDSIMDDFLGGYQIQGSRRRRVKRGGYQTGMEQLEEVRRGLGPARVRPKA